MLKMEGPGVGSHARRINMHIEALRIEYEIHIEINTGEDRNHPLGMERARQGVPISELSSLDSLSGPLDHLGPLPDLGIRMPGAISLRIEGAFKWLISIKNRFVFILQWGSYSIRLLFDSSIQTVRGSASDEVNEQVQNEELDDIDEEDYEPTTPPPPLPVFIR